MGVGRNSLTREEAVNIGVYSVGSQARVFFLHGISAPPPYLGRDFEQNGFGEKRGMVKLNRLSEAATKWVSRIGRESGNRPRFSERARDCGSRESAEGSEKSARIVAPAVRVLGCLTVRASRNSIFVQQCRLVLPQS